MAVADHTSPDLYLDVVALVDGGAVVAHIFAPSRIKPPKVVWRPCQQWAICGVRHRAGLKELDKMDHNDFKFDADAFKKQIGVRRTDVNAATTKLLSYVAHWDEIGRDYLGGIVSVTAVPEDKRIDGDVLGKRFFIRYVAYGLEGAGNLEASLSIKDLVNGEAIEIKSFLVSRTGTFLSLDEQELLSLEDPEFAYKSLVAILRSVMTAPSKL